MHGKSQFATFAAVVALIRDPDPQKGETRRNLAEMDIVAREKWFDAGHTIPPCVNGGCERCVEVRSWSIGGVPSAPAPARLVPA